MQTTTNTQFTIRRATREDSTLLLTWREAMIRDIGHRDDTMITASLAAFTPWLAEHWDHPERFAAYIGEDDGTPVACAMAIIHDWFPGLMDTTAQRGYLFNVYTQPQSRRSGYAGQLVQACNHWLSDHGVQTVGLHASAQGQPVYAQLGFHASGMPEMVCSLK